MSEAAVIERAHPPSAGQLAAARSLPDNQAATWEAADYKIPAAHYTDPAYFEHERAALFGRLPLALAPGALLKPGETICRDDYGVPILLTRDKAGTAHAFLNGCRHRGMRLTSHTAPEACNLVVCPYHAWSYDLTGRLMGVPRHEVFSGVDKAKNGLVALPCEERGGIIWVRLDRDAPADFSHIGAELTADLDALGVAGMHVFAHRRHEVAGNWKLIADAFLEGYHVTRLHAASLGAVSEDVSVTIERIGSHLRSAAGRIAFRQQMVEDAAHSIDALRKVIVFVYTLVPNAVLICSTDYVNLMIFQPQAVDRTMVDNFMLTAYEPTDDYMLGKWQRSLARTDDQAFPEDFSAAAGSQQGLAAGAIDALTLGGMEVGIKLFHDVLGELAP